MKLLMIADDFTGALDAGVQFAKNGFSTRVTVYAEGTEDPGADVDVLVVDAETRHKPPVEAYRVVSRIVRLAVVRGVSYFFKKTDSALRGNIGAELTAMLDASGRRILHFVPAFPQMNRITVDGIHYIDGTPVDKSVFGADPFEPVTTSDVEKLIHQQCETQVELLQAGGNPAVGTEKTIAVYNCTSEQELIETAEQLKENGGLHLVAGCAGLAGILPGLFEWKKEVRERPELPEKFLVVCGSINPITVHQLDYAERHGFFRVRLTPEQKLDPEYFSRKEGRIWLEWLREVCVRRQRVIIDTNDPYGDSSTEHYAWRNKLLKREVRTRIPLALGTIVGYLAEQGLGSAMLMTGGDTLLGCIQHMEDARLTPVGEFDTGIVLSELISKNSQTHVFTKSGGFGEETLLTDMAARICRLEQEERMTEDEVCDDRGGCARGDAAS